MRKYRVDSRTMNGKCCSMPDRLFLTHRRLPKSAKALCNAGTNNNRSRVDGFTRSTKPRSTFLLTVVYLVWVFPCYAGVSGNTRGLRAWQTFYRPNGTVSWDINIPFSLTLFNRSSPSQWKDRQCQWRESFPFRLFYQIYRGINYTGFQFTLKRVNIIHEQLVKKVWLLKLTVHFLPR
jgi:hypothetical protein